MENPHKILVTGATGFIGSRLAHRLIKEGFELGIIKREKSDTWRIKDILGKITTYDADLKDTEKISKVISDFKPDIIFHLATYYAVDHKPEEIPLMIDTNILGTINLLEAAKESKVNLFVNTSSCFVYKESKNKLKETDDLKPLNLYALTKIHAEEACSYYSDTYGLNTITFRLFPPFGPADNKRKLIPYIIKTLSGKETLKLTTGLQRWDFIYVEDIIDAYLKLLKVTKLPEKHDIFNIGTGSTTSIREIACQIKSITKSNIEPEWGAIPNRQNEVWFTCADISKTKRFLNWEPKTHIEQGLKYTIEWFNH